MGEERPDPLAGIVIPRLTDSELDFRFRKRRPRCEAPSPAQRIAGLDERSELLAPADWRLRWSLAPAHWIENSTSSATSSKEENGSGPSSAGKYRSKKLMPQGASFGRRQG